MARPTRRLATASLPLIALAAAACANDADTGPRAVPVEPPPLVGPAPDLVAAEYDLGLPPWAPIPLEPSLNRMTPEKVELGRRLFYDPRLSSDQSKSCASCHLQELAFTDGLARSPGVGGDLTLHNSPSLANVAYLPALNWDNPFLHALEAQGITPLIGERPEELGMAAVEEEIESRLLADPVYEDLFDKAFPQPWERINVSTIVRAISAFQRTIVSFDSPYDRWTHAGDDDAISRAARRGADLFFSARLNCGACHGGPNFNGAIMHADRPLAGTPFHNTGLYNLDGAGAYPEAAPGLWQMTAKPEDIGRFRAPSMRNVALTAPYMHDGSIETLDEVLDHYATGGRTIASGPNAGVGADSPLKSALITGFELSARDRADLIAFLQSLTDETLLANPAYADPWKQE